MLHLVGFDELIRKRSLVFLDSKTANSYYFAFSQKMKLLELNHFQHKLIRPTFFGTEEVMIRNFIFLSLPVVKVNLASFIVGSSNDPPRSKRSVASSNQDKEDPWFDSNGSGGFFPDDEFQFSEFDPSVSYYPSPYCGIVEGKLDFYN